MANKRLELRMDKNLEKAIHQFRIKQNPIPTLADACRKLLWLGANASENKIKEITRLIPHKPEYYHRHNEPNFSGFMPEDCCICGTPETDFVQGSWIWMVKGGTHMAMNYTQNQESGGFMGMYAVCCGCATDFDVTLEGYIFEDIRKTNELTTN